MAKIAVLGSGAWGTALAMSLHRGGHAVQLWSHSPEVAATIQDSRENKRFLPDFRVPEEIAITTSVGEAMAAADILLAVTPSHHVRATFAAVAPHLTTTHIVVSATKGIETATGMRVSEVIAESLGGRGTTVCALSGPSFAQEVAAGRPTAVSLAVPAAAAESAGALQAIFSHDRFRVYTTDDVAGVEFGGSLKNVIAIASGIVAGLELGANSAAALITRGLAEISRLAVACGGRPETLAGLAGMGDLVLTATGSLSRNRNVGLGLGRGGRLEDILAGMGGKVAEGVETTRAALALAARHHVEMPITQQVSDILYGSKPPAAAITELMTRPGREEA